MVFFTVSVGAASKSLGDTAIYDVSGGCISLGAEIKSDVGNFGGLVAFLKGKDGNGLNDNEVSTSQFEGALHWRLHSDGWMANARISGAPIKMKGTRVFRADTGADTIEKTMRGKWDGTTSEESRVGKECVSTYNTRWVPSH